MTEAETSPCYFQDSYLPQTFAWTQVNFIELTVKI